MRNFTICIFLTASIFFIPITDLVAWSDDVSGVLMPSPRGGAGISSDEAVYSVYGGSKDEPEEKPVLIEWDVEHPG